MIKRNLFVLLLSSFCFYIVSCGNGSNSEAGDQNANEDGLSTEDLFDDVDEIRDMYNVTLSNSALESVLKSIPSPLEFADELIDKNVKFEKEMIAPNKSSDEFIGLSSKAIVMGVYGTDLSYINIMNQNLLATQYYSNIVGLAEDLRVDQFFNLSTIEELKRNEGNKEKLLGIIRSNYRDIHKFLEDQDRDHLSLLMLYGSWLESLYITIGSHREEGIDLREMIGEQKITINKLIAALSSTREGKDDIYSAIGDLRGLKNIYDEVEIVYEYDESYLSNVEEGNEVDIIDDSTKTIHITEETISHIEAYVAELRNKVMM